MSKFGHFLYQYKIITFNVLLAIFLVTFNPAWTQLLPDTQEMNYYLGVVFLCGLFFEFASVWFRSRFIFSFYDSLHQKVPWYIGSTFLPRVLTSGALAMLALQSMGALEVSDFFLIPIIIYAAVKEFWVRNVLLDTDRESQNARPPVIKNWLAEILLFLFLCLGYISIWKVYLIPHPRIYYMVLSPINWAFVALGFLLAIYCLEMPHFWEHHLRTKPKRIKVLSVLSLLLPTLALVLQMYMIGFVR